MIFYCDCGSNELKLFQRDEKVNIAWVHEKKLENCGHLVFDVSWYALSSANAGGQQTDIKREGNRPTYRFVLLKYEGSLELVGSK